MSDSSPGPLPLELLSSWGLDRRELTEHEVLLGLYDQMVGDIHRADVLRKVTDVVRGAMNAERATIYVVVRETQELESLTASGLSDTMIRVPIRPGSLSGYCALTGKPFAVPDAYGDLSRIDPRLSFDRSWDERHGFRTRDVICVPVTFKGEILGVIQVINSRDKAFNEEDIPLLLAISRMVGHALHYALVYEELTTLKHLKKEKADFMRIMTHELKSPLSGARMLADAVRYSQNVDAQTLDLIDRLSRRLDSMLAMIGDILEFSQVNAGTPLGEIAALDLGPLTKAICTGFREQAEAKGLALEVAVSDAPVTVRLDRKGFRLIVSNLVSNAVKYTNDGTVTVRLEADDPWSRLDITDTGIGIPADEQGKMFEEFFRASNARRKRIEGTGVGLAGVKAIVDRFNGELEMTSREGEGTTFTVLLPLHTPDA